MLIIYGFLNSFTYSSIITNHWKTIKPKQTKTLCKPVSLWQGKQLSISELLPYMCNTLTLILKQNKSIIFTAHDSRLTVIFILKKEKNLMLSVFLLEK